MNLFINQTIHILCYSPISFLTYLVLGRMLKLRRIVRFSIILTLLHVFFHILYTIAVFYNFAWADFARTAIQFSLDPIAALIASKRKPAITLFGVSFTLMAGILGEVGCVFVFTALDGTFDAHAMSDPFLNTPAYIAMYAVNLILTLFFLTVAWFLWNRIVEKSRPEAMWYYMLFPLSQALLLAIAVLYGITYNMPFARYLYLIPAILFCMLADWLVLRSIRIISEKAVTEERALWYQELLDQQQNYYSYILADQEDASRLRHDMRNQLQTAYALMQSGETTDAQKQLDELSRSVDQAPSFCSNRIVNAILSVKQLQFKDQNITLNCHCSVPENLRVTNSDLCSLFTNLLDNAAEAVAQVSHDSRTISISSDLQSDVFTVRCVNSCKDDIPMRPDHRPDGHGLGLSILRNLAERYQGQLDVSHKNGTFTTTVWLITNTPK